MSPSRLVLFAFLTTTACVVGDPEPLPPPGADQPSPDDPDGAAYDGGFGKEDAIASAAGTVHLRFAGFIPCDAVGIPVPWIRRWSHYKGDDRGFSFSGARHRSRASISVLVSRTRIEAMTPIVGESQGFTGAQVVPDGGPCSRVRAGEQPGERKTDPDAEIVAWHGAQGPDQGYELTKTRLKLHATDPIPYGPVPSLDAYADLWIWWQGSAPRYYYFSGTRDGFPSYELYVNGNLVYGFDAIAAGTGPLALAGAEQFFSSGHAYAVPAFPPGVTP